MSLRTVSFVRQISCTEDKIDLCSATRESASAAKGATTEGVPCFKQLLFLLGNTKLMGSSRRRAQGTWRLSIGFIAGFLLLGGSANAQTEPAPIPNPEPNPGSDADAPTQPTPVEGVNASDPRDPPIAAAPTATGSGAPSDAAPGPSAPAPVDAATLPAPGAPSTELQASGELDTVVVTGSRRSSRTVFDSNVPVDVVSRADLQAIPSGDLNDKLALTIPSFNVQRLPLYDGAIFNRPATLRGLSPDHTLVLINGKRRHRSAYIDVTAQGAQAVDLSEIPLSAIERVEVLRDGASAQYGSDAIAGVINIILRDKPGYSGYLQGSRYYDGDGSNLVGGVNAGWALGGRGTLNLSLEGTIGAATSRSNQRPNAAALIAGGNPNVRQPAVQRFGQPSTRGFTAFVNGKYRLSERVEVYAFGSLGLRRGESDFNYRSPGQGTVFTSIQPADAFQQNFATLPPEYQAWYNNDPAAASGYPGGFTPSFSAISLDRSAVVGVRGELSPALTWDLSGRYGANRVSYRIGNTLNASQGPFSKTEFDPGSKQQTELGTNLDFNYSLGAGLPTPINIAFGGEVRRESYKVVAGEPDSYAIGPLSAIGLAGGANGFFGTAPEQAGSWGRNSVAGYVDVDADLTRRLNLAAAGRVENYSDAGSTVNGKLSSRVALTDYINLRGAISTGFRAPTPGQANLINTAQYPSQDGTAILTIGTIPPTNAISALKGGTALKPEKSVNVSLGVAIQPLKKLTASVDVYRIEVRDRIGLSQRYVLSDDERAALVGSGVAAAEGLSVFNFFVNGYKTRTQGIDVVFAYAIDLPRQSQLTLTSALNLNQTKVLSYRDGVIDAFQRQFIEERLPKRVTTIGAEYALGKASVSARAREYGSWTEPFDPETDASGKLINNQKFGEELFFDVAVSYLLTKGLRLTLGAENVFNNYPDKARFPNTQAAAAAGSPPSNGRVYASQRPYDADGGRYYGRLNFDF